MPSGFNGGAASSLLLTALEAFNAAVNVNPRPSKVKFPISEEEFNTGGFITGVGNSSNVVVDSFTYDEAMKMMDRIDDEMGELFHRISVEVEDMCRTSFVVPQTVPRCLHVCGCIKDSLRTFRGLSDDASTGTRRLVGNMTNIR